MVKLVEVSIKAEVEAGEEENFSHNKNLKIQILIAMFAINLVMNQDIGDLNAQDAKFQIILKGIASIKIKKNLAMKHTQKKPQK